MKQHVEIKNGEVILFRHLKKSDIKGVWNNFNDVLKEKMYLPIFSPVKSEYEKKSWYENIKREHEICIVAEHPDLKPPLNILGQCEISNTDWEAAAHVGILGIIVKKKYRNLGIGFHLIQFALRESKKINNKLKIILSCFSTNEQALYLYQKMGFKVIGVRKGQFYMENTYIDEILMELWIDNYLQKIDNNKF